MIHYFLSPGTISEEAPKVLGVFVSAYNFILFFSLSVSTAGMTVVRSAVV